jgi:hypothetical protein
MTAFSRTDRAVALGLALCASLAIALALAAPAGAETYGNGFQVARFKVEVKGYQTSTWHRTVEAETECDTSDHSFGREKITFHTTKPVYLTATHMPGEFNPQLFGGRQLGIPTVAKVQRSFTPVIAGPAVPCEDNGGGAAATQPDCGSRTVKGWKVNLQYAREKKSALLLSGGEGDDPFASCPGNGIDSFPWLLVEKSGHKGRYIYADLSQDELFDPKFQKWISIAGGSAKDSGDGWWSKTDVHWDVSFTRLKTQTPKLPGVPGH